MISKPTAARLISIFVLALLVRSVSAQVAAAPMIPELNWEPRADWINVKTSVEPGAKGDGVADDTAAIQAALNKMADGATIYFPPGTYRVTKMLVSPPGRFPGVSFIGHGRTSTLAWDGEAGGRMFWTADGMLASRYVGLSWDGRNKAAVGFDHGSQKIFETEMRHQHEAYRNFTEAGIRVGHDIKTATAETLYDNCLFENCKNGVLLESFNVLDHTFDSCEFRTCGVGINGGKGTNFYARNCHFEQSAEVDLRFFGESGSSIRRCTSHGSNKFVVFGSSVGPLVVQDCHVDAWKDAGEAARFDGAPVLMFDCEFTNPPAGAAAPVRTGRAEQRLVVSNNTAAGCPSVVKTAEGGKVVEIPAGKLKGVVKSAAQTFLRSEARIPGKVLDVKRDFGAKGDGGTDDTAAIQKAIDAARAHGKGAIAYVPPGRFAISETLKLRGGDYYFGGSGFRTAVTWKGKPGGTLVDVRDPDRLTIENIILGHHDGGPGENAIDIQQTGMGKASSITYDRVWAWGMYQKKPLERGYRFTGLGKEDRVYVHEGNGNMRFTDSADATIFLGLSYEGTLVVEGKSPARGGFLGGGVRLATVADPALWVKDNQSIVLGDLYSESSEQILRLEGDPSLPPGRVTISGAKFEIVKPENIGGKIENYRGELVIGPYQFYPGNPVHHFTQTGDAPFSLTLLSSMFYNCKPEFKFSPAGKVAVVGGDSVIINKADAAERVPNIADTTGDDAIGSVSKALDDYRRLGAVDMEMRQADAK